MMLQRYQAMIGVGGIGTGVFFALDGQHTLGREESRSGRLLERRDYCKLHIVCHYVARLLGPAFPVIPIGRVGTDEPGERLLAEMAAVGLDLHYVLRTPGAATLYAICLVYPDGSGGNLTTADSASDLVDEALVQRAGGELAKYAGAGMAVALPEVPLAARRSLLALGRRHGFMGIAAFNSAELRELRAGDMIGDWLADIDLLALNLDEAAALTGLAAEATRREEIVEATTALLRGFPRPPLVTITAGRHGSWSSDGARVDHRPALPVDVVSTAGAGDAHLSGTIAGLAAGLSLAESHELGVLVAAMSVTSPHTIHDGIGRQTLRVFAEAHAVASSPAVAGFLKGDGP
jgi:sugar/nucleoside kinase (ribokinase family)